MYTAARRAPASPVNIVLSATNAGMGEAVVVVGFVRDHHHNGGRLVTTLQGMVDDGSLQRLVADYREREARRAEIQDLRGRGAEAERSCPRCDGAGGRGDGDPLCYFCRGTGSVS
ncbi:hypothetical protein ACFOVU_21240 [Nocardiopsis sediminis]|uniref:Uncharacterized protein n=1 Tax=Nocardiopsis sediminis TaxID=1778267 RepID=A0ABV8FQV2_9ACTN